MRFLGAVARQFPLECCVIQEQRSTMVISLHLHLKSLREHFEPSASGSNNFLQPLQVIIQYKNHGCPL